MSQITLSIQIALGLSLLLLAVAGTTKIRMLQFIGALTPSTRTGRIAGSALFLVAGIATLVGALVPFAVFFASCLGLLSSAYIALRAVREKVFMLKSFSLCVAGGSIALAIVQPLGLKVLALPKADDLPVTSVPARVVKTYDEGLWLEGIAAGTDGTLYLTGNRKLDFSRSDYYREAQGEVIERKPNGEERVVFKTPVGSTAGVPAVGGDGGLYITSHGDSPAIWKISADGEARKLAQLPQGAWPNGIDIGPDGKIYSPDSSLGVIWRVDPDTGDAKQVISDKLLLARPFISLAPGANGLHFKGQDMYVTVSDRTSILKYTLRQAGQFGAPIVVATGIPGDDFAIGKDGSLFVTTHPYNTVVRVTPDGVRTIIGNQDQHVIGATDAVFGTGINDQHTLYVVTDGGAFTGGPKTRGELIALQPYK